MITVHLKVLHVVATVETTVLVCSRCGLELSNPKIEV